MQLSAAGHREQEGSRAAGSPAPEHADWLGQPAGVTGGAARRCAHASKREHRVRKRHAIFISGSDKLRISTEDAYREGVDVETQNAMMAARFRYFYFPHSRSEGDCKRCAPCGSCFSRWLQSLPAPPLTPRASSPSLGIAAPTEASAVAATARAKPRPVATAAARAEWRSSHTSTCRTRTQMRRRSRKKPTPRPTPSCGTAGTWRQSIAPNSFRMFHRQARIYGAWGSKLVKSLQM